nr:hypothetical protein [Tanacetum cinerariifolium]
MVDDDDDETSKDNEIDKLMALISLSCKKIYKPTNNNLQTSSNTSRANQDNSLRINRNAGYESQKSGNIAGARETVQNNDHYDVFAIECQHPKQSESVYKTYLIEQDAHNVIIESVDMNYDSEQIHQNDEDADLVKEPRECQKPKRAKDAAYHREKMLLCKQEEAGIQLNAEQADWRDDTDDEELEDQELEAHYMYIAQLQEVSPDAVNYRPIIDDEPLQKVSNDDHYNVFAIESAHLEQSKSMHDTEEIDQNDDDNDLAKERELLASLIEKLKCEINESKNRNKFLETSNKVIIENLKGEIEDFKNTNKSLKSPNNFFKEANNKLSEINNLLYADYKKSEEELARRNSKEYAS